MGVYLATPNKEKESDDGGLIELNVNSSNEHKSNCASEQDFHFENSSFVNNLNFSSSSSSVYTSSRYGVTEMQGWRHSMEDAHIAMPSATKYNLGIYGVFDGHGGNSVSAWVALHFIEIFESQLEFCSKRIEENSKFFSFPTPEISCISNDATGTKADSSSCGEISSSPLSSSTNDFLSKFSSSVSNSTFSSYISPSEEFLFCEALKLTFFNIDLLLQTEESRNELKVLHNNFLVAKNNKDSNETNKSSAANKSKNPAMHNWLQYFLSDSTSNKKSDIDVIEQDGQKYFQLSSEVEDESITPEKEIVKSNLKVEEIFDEESNNMEVDTVGSKKEEDISMEGKTVDADLLVSLVQEEKEEGRENETKSEKENICDDTYDDGKSGRESLECSLSFNFEEKESLELDDKKKEQENMEESSSFVTYLNSCKDAKVKNEKEKECLKEEESGKSGTSALLQFSTANDNKSNINVKEEEHDNDAIPNEQGDLESPVRRVKMDIEENIKNSEKAKDAEYDNKNAQEFLVNVANEKYKDDKEHKNILNVDSFTTNGEKNENKNEDLLFSEDVFPMNEKILNVKYVQEKDILNDTNNEVSQNEKIYDEEERPDLEEEHPDLEEESPDLENNYLENDPRTPESCGATAVVVVLITHSDTPVLLVANAGDSRAVLCRNGKAVALSVDHKPNMPQENIRIYRAGGYVTAGRVDGNLNLSRSLGDLCYKQDKNLKQEQQKITALPDIRITPVTDEDEFLVIACDGIWDCLTNQEVIDFVASRLHESSEDKSNKKLSKICEDLCDKCLSPSPFESDSIGCDNMTCMIVEFSHKIRKKLNKESKIFLYGVGEDKSIKLFDNYYTLEEKENVRNIGIGAKRNKNKAKKKPDLYNNEDDNKFNESDEEILKYLSSQNFNDEKIQCDYGAGITDDGTKKKKKKEKKKKSKNFDSGDIFIKSSKDEKIKKIESKENVEASQEHDENLKRKLGGKKRKEKNLNEMKKNTEKRKVFHEKANSNDITLIDNSKNQNSTVSENLIKHDLYESDNNNANGIPA